MNLYYTIMTLRGQQKLEEYYHADKTLKLTHMGFGGINGDPANYIAPDVNATEIAHEWARIELERAPAEGFIGGGVTINNDNPDHKGHWICNVGIYDEDGELILISAYRPTLIDPSRSVIAAYIINIQTALSNAANVVVVTDTSITHPTHDELNAAIGSVERKIPLAATHDEVAQSVNDKKFVTPATLNKKGLIQQLQDYATQTANKVKEDIYGGVPAVTLDTIKEVADALTQTGDAVKSIFTKLGSLTTAVDSNKNAINNHQASHAAHTPAQVGAAPADHSHTPAQVGAAPAVHSHTPAQVGLGSVNNWPASSAVNDASDNKYATTHGVKKAFDKAVDAYNKATEAKNRVPKMKHGSSTYISAVKDVVLSVGQETIIMLNNHDKLTSYTRGDGGGIQVGANTFALNRLVQGRRYQLKVSLETAMGRNVNGIFKLIQPHNQSGASLSGSELDTTLVAINTAEWSSCQVSLEYTWVHDGAADIILCLSAANFNQRLLAYKIHVDVDYLE